jgi:hypothetical protein
LNTTVSNTSAGVILASGVAARVELNGATISGGKLQTLAGGEIDADFGSLTDTTIASGSVVMINDGDTLIISGLINNLGVISAVGSANPAHLTVAGTVVLSGGGKVSLSSSGNNHIGAVSSGSTLSNVNNTIAGAGVIDFGLAVVNGGKLEATTSNTLNLQANVSNTALGTILASGRLDRRHYRRRHASTGRPHHQQRPDLGVGQRQPDIPCDLGRGGAERRRQGLAAVSERKQSYCRRQQRRDLEQCE